MMTRLKSFIRRGGILGSIAFSIASSVRTGRFTWVWFDGEDWIHRWRGGALVWHTPLRHPEMATVADMPLFTYQFMPKRGDTILDIGAGAGTEVLAFARLVGPEGSVIAVEPDPDAHRRLVKLTGLLALTNVTVVRSAVGSSLGSVFLSRDGEGSTTNRVVAGGADTVSVPLTTLDELTSRLSVEVIHLLKMNIEGGERDALIGFAGNWDRVQNWCIGCHDFLGPETATFEFVSTWLSERGLAVIRHPVVVDSPWAGDYVYA